MSTYRGIRACAALASVVALVVAGLPVAAVADEHVAASSTVNDPFRPLQWYLDRISAPRGWDVTRGDPEVTIALIDTGVDPDHPDLAGALWRDPNSGSAGFNHVDGSFETYTSREADWHGTATAGIAVARADDEYGIAGVAPEVKLMVHRIYSSTAYGEAPEQATYANAIRAIEDSVDAGADVILMPWGGTRASASLEQAIQNAGVPVVAAAGNDGQDLSNFPEIRRYPAMYQLSNLVTVAATDRDNRIVEGEFASNYGVRNVDIAAPGLGIVSLSAGADHDAFTGTSFAAPQVAGALALGRSYAPDASAAVLVSALIRSARRSSNLSDKVTSGGILDVPAFLRAVTRPACIDEIPPSSFTDVRGSTHLENIHCVVWFGVARGVDEDRFAPRRVITRGEMATFLARTLEAGGHDGSQAPAAGFSDVPGTTHERSIDIVADAGIALGTGDGRFEPSRTVTRGQMATFVVGVVELLTQQALATDRDWFDDVDGTTHERAILLARELEITLGTSDPRTFEPLREMSREQMASFVARTLDALGRQGIEVTPLP